MNRTARIIVTVVVPAFVVSAGLAYADFEIDWHSIDGGGEIFSTGGTFELGGTIGQADANAMVLTGGGFELVGGFWAVAVPTCGCLSDLDNDGQRTGADVQGFVDCLTATGTNCACADVDGIFGLTVDDIAAFVADLLDGTDCP